jgi:predicted aldo/keto reductase-like oxidoreductase
VVVQYWRRFIIQYRKFGRLDWQVSALALGTASLPPDGSESAAMVRYAVDRGINYLDIGYTPDIGKRENISRGVARALRDGYRQKIRVALTLPSRNVGSAADLDRYLQRQLDLLELPDVDFCLLGWLDRQIWPDLLAKKVLDWADSILADGRVGHLGFCFHDDYQTLRNVLDAYSDWSLCQVLFSFMDVDHHPGVGGIRLAAAGGLAVVTAGPLKGGRLARRIPPAVAEIWGAAPSGRSPAEWALRWVWHHPEVAAVISDAANLEELGENIDLAGAASADSLTVPEQILVNRVRDAYRALKPVNCTACRGCMPCPRDVDFPRVFELYNDAVIYDDVAAARKIYLEEGHHLAECDGCGRCEEACGRQVAVRDWLDKAHRLLTP